MNILITGGTGFLGSHLAHRLLREGHRVRVLGRNQTVLAELERKGADAIHADLRDAHAMSQACRGLDAVCHAGALSSAWGKRADFYTINVGGTRNVVRACHEHGVRRLIYVSSASVVFSGRDCFGMNEQTPIPRGFLSVYSQTKKRGEDVVRAASTSGLETVIVRPKAIFGPGDPSLLPRILRAARAGRLVQIGDGRNVIDLTFVDNVVEALVLALGVQAAAGQTYTISGGEPTPIWPTIAHVLRELGLPHELRVVPFRLAYALAWLMEGRARFSQQEPVLTRFGVALLARSQTCDLSKARRELGYAPVVSVAQGIERTIAALKALENT